MAHSNPQGFDCGENTWYSQTHCLFFQQVTNSNIPEGTQLSGYGSELYPQELDWGENTCYSQTH